MTPGVYNFTLYQGTNDGLTLTIQDNNVPLDLTGYSAEMKVRKNPDAANPLLVASSTGLSPKITITALQGKIEVAFLPSDTTSLPFKGDELDCVYDLEVTSPAGVVTRVLMGDVVISREITR